MAWPFDDEETTAPLYTPWDGGMGMSSPFDGGMSMSAPSPVYEDPPLPRIANPADEFVAPFKTASSMLIDSLARESSTSIGGIMDDINKLKTNRESLLNSSENDWRSVGSGLLGAVAAALGGAGGSGIAGAFATQGLTYYNNLEAQEKEKLAANARDIGDLEGRLGREQGTLRSFQAAGLQDMSQAERDANTAKIQEERDRRTGAIPGSPESKLKMDEDIAKFKAQEDYRDSKSNFPTNRALTDDERKTYAERLQLKPEEKDSLKTVGDLNRWLDIKRAGADTLKLPDKELKTLVANFASTQQFFDRVIPLVKSDVPDNVVERNIKQVFPQFDEAYVKKMLDFSARQIVNAREAGVLTQKDVDAYNNVLSFGYFDTPVSVLRRLTEVNQQLKDATRNRLASEKASNVATEGLEEMLGISVPNYRKQAEDKRQAAEGGSGIKSMSLEQKQALIDQLLAKQGK